MENNLNTLDIAKEIVRIDNNIDTIVEKHNGLVCRLNEDQDYLTKCVNILKSRTAFNTILIVGVIGYIVYKEFKAKNDEQ